MVACCHVELAVAFGTRTRCCSRMLSRRLVRKARSGASDGQPQDADGEEEHGETRRGLQNLRK
jgi:hypothetical protein